MKDTNCPSCGAKVVFQSTVSLLAVCSYCRSLLMRDDLNIKDLGKVAELQQDGTPLQVGTRGTYKTVGFSLLGRMQLRYPDGFWNEWYAGFDDGRQGWLGEAQGVYAVSFRAETKGPLPDRESLEIGRKLKLAGSEYEVRDLHEASYLSAEGELPLRPPLGESNAFADLGAAGGRFATLDYSEDPPLLFTGEFVEFDALRLDGLKAVEGW